MIQRDAYSYRDDPSVPVFDDARPVVVYDGVCRLCSGSVRFILERDAETRFLAAQSYLSQALYRHYGLDAVTFETLMLLENGRCYVEADAVERLMRRFGGGWARGAAVLSILPRVLRSWLYRRVARNRYRLFGRRDRCLAPTPDVMDRFIAWE